MKVTRLDFGIHLFRAARDLNRTTRFSPVTLLVLLGLARDLERWHPTGEVACIAAIDSHSLAASLAPAVDLGWIERRQLGGPKSVIEWRLTAKGQQVVEKLMKPEPLAVPA